MSRYRCVISCLKRLGRWCYRVGELNNTCLCQRYERKAELVATLVAKGVAATTSETWESLTGKVIAQIKATGNAIADDLLSGKTASNNNGPITGTMPNRSGSNSAAGWADGVTTVRRLFLRPQAGYWDGTKFTYADDNNYILKMSQCLGFVEL
ncbi:hypothetical protein D3C74_262970 [compost metagenome]